MNLISNTVPLHGHSRGQDLPASSALEHVAAHPIVTPLLLLLPQDRYPRPFNAEEILSIQLSAMSSGVPTSAMLN